MTEPPNPALPERPHRVARWAGYSAGLLILLACAGALYQAVGGMRDRRSNPPPGRFVEVAGLRMHLVCAGQGSPTVILDSGLSDTWLHWYKVQPEVAKFARVCAYDRAGLGWSDPRPGPRTSRPIAEELHTLLQNAAVAPPFVLVGHSMGGLDVLMYTSLYRAEVVGMVLVDSSHPDQYRRIPPESRSSGNGWLRAMKRDRALMPFGVPRLLGWCGAALPDRRAAFRAFDCTAQQKLGTMAEIAGFNESLDQTRAAGSLGDLPLIVVSEAPSDPAMKRFLSLWEPLQDDLAHRSSRGRRVIAEGSSHQVHRDRPDVVIAAIRDVVVQSRRQ
ncbi:MAG TPA: alpha/beta hydrolase [Bryobacteraceae bacterium]|nr:alpha/beta hydrolase [Bryobacteraceae bacterium]